MVRLLIATLVVLSCLQSAFALEEGCAARSGTFAVNGVSLYWEEHGNRSGPPLLLVHGFGESLSVWEPYVPLLCTKYDVVLIDLRGHGRSTNPTQKFSLSAVANDISSLMDHLHHPQFRAMGASAGAIALLHIATSASQRIQSLVLVSAAPYIPREARERLRNISKDKDTPDYLRRFASRGDEQVKSLLLQHETLAASSIDDPAFTPPKLGTITASTLIVHGDRDEFFPVELAVDLYRSIPKAYLRIYPNGGHEPIYEPTAVADFAKQLIDFFDHSWDAKTESGT